MKITKRQLRRIIREAMYSGHDQMAGAQGYNMSVIEDLADRAAGGYEPEYDGSPEQFAPMIIDYYLSGDAPAPLDQPEYQEVLAKHPDLVEKEIIRAVRRMQ